MIPAPKFKKGDMVVFVDNKSAPGECDPRVPGMIMTIISHSGPDWMGFYRYRVDRRHPDGTDDLEPIEPCLRLIRDGDLKLDNAPAEDETIAEMLAKLPLIEYTK